VGSSPGTGMAYFLWRNYTTLANGLIHPPGTGMAYFLRRYCTTLASGVIPREQEWHIFFGVITQHRQVGSSPGTGMAYFLWRNYTTLAGGLIPGIRNGIFSLAYTQH
jgi:hypothetical protein